MITPAIGDIWIGCSIQSACQRYAGGVYGKRSGNSRGKITRLIDSRYAVVIITVPQRFRHGKAPFTGVIGGYRIGLPVKRNGHFQTSVRSAAKRRFGVVSYAIVRSTGIAGVVQTPVNVGGTESRVILTV